MKNLTVRSGSGAASKEFAIQHEGDTFTINHTAHKLELVVLQGELIAVRLGNKTFTAYCKKSRDNHYEIWINDHVIPVMIEDEIGKLLAQFQKQSGQQTGQVELRAPMPGLVTGIAVEPGQAIKKDMKLATLEAMKMENEIRSPIDGVVKKIEVSKGSKVEKDQRLFVLARE